MTAEQEREFRSLALELARLTENPGGWSASQYEAIYRQMKKLREYCVD